MFCYYNILYANCLEYDKIMQILQPYCAYHDIMTAFCLCCLTAYNHESPPENYPTVMFW